jgi:hypothetical protein
MTSTIITLVFTLCLASAPRSTEDCQVEKVQWDGSMLQCELFGQQHIAMRVAQRPELVNQGKYQCIQEPSGIMGQVG